MEVIKVKHSQLVSTLAYGDSPIDSRSLSLRCEFYQLSYDNILELTNDLGKWLYELYSENFFVELEFCNRHISSPNQLKSKLSSAVRNGEWWSFSTEGFVRSPLLGNHVRPMLKRIKLLRTTSGNLPNSPSYDYPDYWTSLFPAGRCENDELLHKVYGVFRESSRFYINQQYVPDVRSVLIADTYKNDRKLYHASFSLDVCKVCVESVIDSLSTDFSEYLQHLSTKFVAVNGRVMLQPIHIMGVSPHMVYFSQNPATDQSHVETNYVAEEWYRTYYIPGAEWCNVISPLARSHIHQVNSHLKENTKIEIKELSGGGLFVASKKNISLFDVNDLRPIKEILYNALYPGSYSLSIRDMFRRASDGKYTLCPRSDWGNIPMLDGEIKIVSTYLVYRHLS